MQINTFPRNDFLAQSSKVLFRRCSLSLILFNTFFCSFILAVYFSLIFSNLDTKLCLFTYRQTITLTIINSASLRQFILFYSVKQVDYLLHVLICVFLWFIVHKVILGCDLRCMERSSTPACRWTHFCEEVRLELPSADVTETTS